MCGRIQRRASAVGFPVTTLALPSVAATVQVTIGRDRHLLAALRDGRVAALTVPAVPRIAQVGMRGDFDGDTLHVLATKSAPALPSPAIHRGHQVSIRRHGNFHAGAIPFLVAAVAAPAVTVGSVVRIGAGGHTYRNTGLALAHEIALALPGFAGEIQESMFGHLDGIADFVDTLMAALALPSFAIAAGNCVGGEGRDGLRLRTHDEDRDRPCQ